MTTDDTLAPELDALEPDDADADADDVDAPTLNDDPDQGDETFDSAAEAAAFLAAFPGSEERAAIAAAWTDEQRAEMAARDIHPGGPISEEGSNVGRGSMRPEDARSSPRAWPRFGMGWST